MSFPDGWRVVAISDVCVINPKSNYQLLDDDDVTFVPMKAVDDVSGCIIAGERKLLSEVKKGFTYFSEGDVLFAKITPCMENGKSAIAKDLINNVGYGSTEFHVLRPSAYIKAEYLHFFLRQESFRLYAKNHYVGSAGQQRVPTSFFRAAKIPLPSLEEQQYIVEILKQAEDLCHLRQDSLTKAEKLASALFLEMFGDPDPKNNPRWDSTLITTHFSVETGGTPKRLNDKNYGNDVHWAKSTDLKSNIIYETEEKISEDGLKSSNAKIFPPETILLAMYGQGKTRGHTAKLGIPAACNQACAALVVKKDSQIMPDYLWFWLQCSYERIRALGRGGQQENLNLSIVKSLLLTKPPVELQREFSKKIENVFHIIEEIDFSGKKLKALLSNINQRVFIGKLTEQWRERNGDVAPIRFAHHIKPEPIHVVSSHYSEFYRQWMYGQLSILQRRVLDYFHANPSYLTEDDLGNLIDELPEDINHDQEQKVRKTLEQLVALGLIMKVSVQDKEGGFVTAYRALRKGDDSKGRDRDTLEVW